MNVKKIKKNVTETEILYQNLINTVYGSLILSVLILTQKKCSKEVFNARMKKGKFPYMEDKDFIRKTLKAFDESIDYENEVMGLPLCVVESDWNTLILPYIIEDNQVIPMPINQDGILPQTVLKMKSYHIVDWEEE